MRLLLCGPPPTHTLWLSQSLSVSLTFSFSFSFSHYLSLSPPLSHSQKLVVWLLFIFPPEEADATFEIISHGTQFCSTEDFFGGDMIEKIFSELRSKINLRNFGLLSLTFSAICPLTCQRDAAFFTFLFFTNSMYIKLALPQAAQLSHFDGKSPPRGTCLRTHH